MNLKLLIACALLTGVALACSRPRAPIPAILPSDCPNYIEAQWDDKCAWPRYGDCKMCQQWRNIGVIDGDRVYAYCKGPC